MVKVLRVLGYLAIESKKQQINKSHLENSEGVYVYDTQERRGADEGAILVDLIKHQTAEDVHGPRGLPDFLT